MLRRRGRRRREAKRMQEMMMEEMMMEEMTRHLLLLMVAMAVEDQHKKGRMRMLGMGSMLVVLKVLLRVLN
jgi:hypothetical protein